MVGRHRVDPTSFAIQPYQQHCMLSVCVPIWMIVWKFLFLRSLDASIV